MRNLTTLLSWRFFIIVYLSCLSFTTSAQNGPCDGSVQIPDTVRTQINCSITVSLEGLEPSSITWKDLNTSRGAYLRYLDCAQGCGKVTFSTDSTAERFIRYEVCGNISAGQCPQNYSICDTIVLEVIPTPRTTSRIDICEGFAYEWQDRLFTEEGFYTDTLASSLGCDSLVSLDLKVNPSRKGTLSATICPGEYFELGGERFNESGAYEVTLTDSINCDSIVILSLEVLPGPAPSIEGPPILCNGATATLLVPAAGSFTAFRWSNGGATSSIEVTDPGTYSVTVSAANGCATPVSYSLEGAPALDASITGTSSINCFDQMASLRSEFFPDPAAPGVKTEWRNREERLLSEAATFETTQPGWYYLEVTDASGFCSDKDSVLVRESEGLPKFTLSSSGALDCRSEEVLLTIELQSNLSNQLIRWTGPGVISGSPSLNVSEPGWYIMEVTNLDLGCTVKDSIRVTRSRQAPDIRLADKAVLRCDPAEVTLKARVKGKVLYNWRTSDGQLEGDLNASQVKATRTGWYFVDVLNENNGCSATDSVRVLNPSLIQGVDLSVKASCSNDPEGRIKINEVYGGKTPYQFELDTGQKPTKNMFTNLNPGTYQVLLVDGFGCRWDTTVTIQTIEIDSSMEMVEICEGMTYSWNRKDYGETGVYTDTLTASTGCDSIATLDLRVNTTLNQVSREAAFCPGGTYDFQGQRFTRPGTYQIPIPGTTGCDTVITLSLSHLPVDTPEISGPSVLCEGDSAELRINGSFSNYEWSDGSTTDAIVVRQEGNYSVTVTDVQGCKTQTIYRLEVGDIPVASITGDTLITCEQPIATLQSGPIPEGYGLTWFNPRGDEIGGEPSVQATEPGNHLLRVADPSGTCTATDSFLVEAGNELPPLTVSSPESLTCQRLEINLSAEAGTGNYQVAWSGPGILSGRNTFSPSVDRTGLYRIVVTDEDTRCTISATVQVSADRDNPTVEVGGQTRLDCSTGEARLQASSPDPGVTFEWQTESGLITGATNQAEVVVADTGWYELITTNGATGCTALDRIYVDYPEGPTDVEVRTIATCANEMAGYIIVDRIIDGTPLFTYSLNDIPDEQGSYSGLSPGTYQLDLIDSRGCIFPNFLEVDSLPVPETVEEIRICEGETFVWKDSVYSASGRYVDTLMAANGCDSLDVLELQVQPAPRRDIQVTLCEGELFQIGDSVLTEAGTYMLFLPNPGGCDSLIQVDVNVLPVDSLTILGPVEFCAGQRVQLRATGNFAVYEWNTGGTDSTLEVGAGGMYTLTATTAEGCERTTEFELRELESPTAVIFGDSLITCRDTIFSLQAQALEPASGWSLNWQDSSRQTLAGTEVLDISDPGWYYLEVSDPSSGCTSLDSIFVREGRAIPEISTSGTYALTCRAPVINLEITIASGSSGTELDWSGPGIVDGGQTSSPMVDQPGLYRITALDTSSRCSASDSLLVLDDRQPPILMLPDSIGLDCITGEAFLSANAGGDSLRYQWTTRGGQIDEGSQAPQIVVDSPGLYVLEVANQANGCVALDSVSVFTLTGPEQALVEIKPSCLQAEDGRVAVTAVEGGTAPYLFSLNGAAFTNNDDFLNLKEGTYNLAVEDAEGCVWDTTVIVSLAPVFDVSLGDDQRIFLGDSIRLDPLLSLPAENIAGLSWSPPAGLSCTDCLNPYAAPVTSTTYRLELIDQYGCNTKVSLRINVDSRVPVYIPDAFSPNGDGINDYFTVFTYSSIRRIKELLIFNRWGETVFQMEDFIPNDPLTGWDGKVRGRIANTGVYVYYLLIEFLDGEEVVFKGDVTLIR